MKLAGKLDTKRKGTVDGFAVYALIGLVLILLFALVVLGVFQIWTDVQSMGQARKGYFAVTEFLTKSEPQDWEKAASFRQDGYLYITKDEFFAQYFDKNPDAKLVAMVDPKKPECLEVYCILTYFRGLADESTYKPGNG